MMDKVKEINKYVLRSKMPTQWLTTLWYSRLQVRAMINKANTNEWTGGEAWIINAALVNQYRPDDIIASAEARHMLKYVSMKKNLNNWQKARLPMQAQP
jgi:hypothetical protein